MKKLIALLMALCLALALVGCGGGGSAAPADSTPASGGAAPEAAGDAGDSANGAEVVLIISAAGVKDDGAFNEACDVGMQEWCAENGKSYAYLQPTEDTVDAQRAVCDNAVKNGAKFIVLNSDQFKLSATYMQEDHPDISFLIFDTVPERDGAQVVNDNMKCITFSEQQCAYIAGYAAVVEGYTSLGYLGGMPVPAVVRFGYGFVDGANQACEDLGIDSIDMRFAYFGGFDPTPQNKALATSWYESGTECIFCAAGGAGGSVAAAAEDTKKKMIGVDADQYQLSDTVITSAIKDLANICKQELTAWNDGSWAGGQIVNSTAADGGVAIVMEEGHARLEKFTQADYDGLYERIATDEGGMASNIPTDLDAPEGDPTPIADRWAHINLTYVNN